jgi:hypothetical protein
LFCIFPNSSLSSRDLYFPELRLATEIKRPVFAITLESKLLVSPRDLAKCYKLAIQFTLQTLSKKFSCQNKRRTRRNLNQIVLVDGGCDLITFGKELNLGTPSEDYISLKAIDCFQNEAKNKNKKNKNKNKNNYLKKVHYMILCIGVDCDTFHHGIPLNDLPDILKGYKKKDIWSSRSRKVRRYIEIVQKCCPQHTKVQSLVVAAIHGKKGFYTPKTWTRCQNRIFLNERVCTAYWFQLKSILKRNKILPHFRFDDRIETIDTIIGEIHDQLYVCSYLEKQVFGFQIPSSSSSSFISSIIWNYIESLFS